MKKVLALTLVMVVLGFAADAVTIPRLISVQGLLVDSLGNPVPDSSYDVAFRLYTVPAGGSPYWTETQTIGANGGLFAVMLGSVNPVQYVPDSGGLYLGMEVGGAELSPRVRMVSSAYAFKADTANYALSGAGGDDAWMRGAPDSVLFTVRRLGIARGEAGNDLLGAGRHTHVNFGVECTTGLEGADHTGCTVGGGFANLAAEAHATVAGGGSNEALAGYAFVGGGSSNTASGSRATVSGGRGNAASGTNATVSGGKYTVASGYCSTIGGGVDNQANGNGATAAGGSGNIVNGDHGACGGGFANEVDGFCAAVPGGSQNAALGYGSLAAGTRARAKHRGSFVWGDSAASYEDTVFSTGPDQFRVRARGGTWFFSNREMTSGAYLAPGSNSWASACDRATKEDFQEVDRAALLARVVTLPVRDYRMKDQHPGIRHIGPVAQDFAAAFGYGETDKAINLSDADGVLFAAVQALYDQNRAQQEEIEALKARLDAR